jgi:hypothetical protein
MTTPYDQTGDKRGKISRDERPSIIVRNQKMVLELTEGKWQEKGNSGGKTWTAIDNRGRPATDLRVRVVQGSDTCQGVREGSPVTILFGSGSPPAQILTVNLEGKDPLFVSSVGLTKTSEQLLEGPEPSPLRRVTVAGHSPCELSGGQVRIELCLKGESC